MAYKNFAEWVAVAERGGISLAQVVLENEMELTGSAKEAVYETMQARLDVMQAAALGALDKAFTMPAMLISGQAQKQNAYAPSGGYTGERMNRVMAMALSASEVNASMGRVCAAPTAGSCGVLPAVLIVAAEETAATQAEILDALFVASGVGAIITRNATVSGAKGGCQAECGSAAAMAAAASVVLKKGSHAQVGAAISIALMNCMGLICDPVAGLVQLPCSFRNASQAVNALISADMALAGQDAVIPADEAIEAMYKVGRLLPVTLRETAEGGIAATKTGKRIAKEFFDEA